MIWFVSIGQGSTFCKTGIIKWTTHLTIGSVSIGQGSTFCKTGIVKWRSVSTTRAVFIGRANTFHTVTMISVWEAALI